MLRDELLRSKKDEIARCLSSRKRKLSELYYATLGIAVGATDGLYQQKEQAFLDANDLSRGRYFNESTLPPLPSYDTVSSQLEIEKPTPSFAEPHAKPETHDVATEARLSKRDDVSHVSAIDSLRPLNQEQPATVPVQHISLLPHPTAGRPIAESSQDSNVESESKPAIRQTQLSDTGSRSRSPVSEISPSDQGSKSETSSSPDEPTPVRSTPSSIEDTGASRIRKPNDSYACLTQGLPHPERPSSLSSPVDPNSSITPAPVTTSQGTSLTGEAIRPADEIQHRNSKGAKALGYQDVAPSTPDEQLRLERAESERRIALEVGRLADNRVNGSYSPAVSSTMDEDSAKLTQTASHAPVLLADRQADDLTNTQIRPSTQQAHCQTGSGSNASNTLPLTPKEVHPAVSAQTRPPQPERMMTRVSSGAIRHKSVSEILGETPKPAAAAYADRSTEPISSSESTARMRLKARKEREKERSKLSTVVFPSRQQLLQQEKSNSMDLVRQSANGLEKINEEQDYLFTLFQNKAYSHPRGQSLSSLLASAHKTLSTANHLVDYSEQMDCRTLHRIYSLQHANRWPLRQLKRSIEPPRQGTHWDILLDHAKWLRTDFREERKWKIAAAKCCAEWCAEYVNSDQGHRALLRVAVRTPRLEDINHHSTASPAETGDELPDLHSTASHPTPDLVPSAEIESVSDSVNDELQHDLPGALAPAAIFSLASDEFTFSLDMTPAAEKLLGELPIYVPVKISPETSKPAFNALLDSAWKADILPVSKYATGKITFGDVDPPRKRSRYDYTQYKEELENQIINLPPEQTNVALFRPENQHIRDRIHPGHSFRPPTEHPMPSVGFFESRQSSQWTYAEDDELRQLVKEYSYNWSLISSCLSPLSLFSSGAERRTPWECFERWISLEGLPADMSRTQYFRAYHQRLETAQRTVLAQQQAAQQQQQQQQQGNSQQQPLPLRRRTTQPLRVDRRKSSRHFALLDAMRKLAKKRETILQKQQQAAHLASLRKATETAQPKPIISSPAEFSRLKYDREMKLQERQEQYRQQMIAQQRANLVAQRAGQIPNSQAMMSAPGRNPSGMSQNSASPGIPGSTPGGIHAGVSVSQGRPPHLQGMASGPSANGPMPPSAVAMKMMPQSGIGQAASASGRPGMTMQGSPDSGRVIREANRLHEQQRILQSRQQQQQIQQGQSQSQQQFPGQQQFGPQGPHSPNLNMASGSGAPNNANIVAALQAASGMQNSAFHGAQGISTPSPRIGQPSPLSSGVVPTISNIQNQIQRNNPNMSPEQVNKLATERLHQYQQQRMSQVAMSAAAGNIGAIQHSYQTPHESSFQQQSPHSLNGSMQAHQPQGYSPMMRVGQNAQQSRANVNVGGSPTMNGAISQQSRSSTPQAQRNGNNTQGGSKPGSSNSPRLQQAQVASG